MPPNIYCNPTGSPHFLPILGFFLKQSQGHKVRGIELANHRVHPFSRFIRLLGSYWFFKVAILILFIHFILFISRSFKVLVDVEVVACTSLFCSFETKPEDHHHRRVYSQVNTSATTPVDFLIITETVFYFSPDLSWSNFYRSSMHRCLVSHRRTFHLIAIVMVHDPITNPHPPEDQTPTKTTTPDLSTHTINTSPFSSGSNSPPSIVYIYPNFHLPAVPERSTSRVPSPRRSHSAPCNRGFGLTTTTTWFYIYPGPNKDETDLSEYGDMIFMS